MGDHIENTSPETMVTLDGLNEGRWVVTTAKGTRHLVDLRARFAMRFAAAGREWTAAGVGYGPVTPDRRPLFYGSLTNATVGQRMRLDSSDEWRLTSSVTAIEPLDAHPDLLAAVQTYEDRAR